MSNTETDYLGEHYYDSSGQMDTVGSIPTGVDALNDYGQPTDQTSASVLQLRAQYAEELKQVEEEIQTLKQVLAAKCRRHTFLKRQLGITVMSELREEMNKGMDNLRTMEAYQKTTAAVKTAKDKTSAALYDRWNVLKQTNAFKSLEGKLGTAYSSVRGKLVRSATIGGTSGNATSLNTEDPQLEEVQWSKDDGISTSLNQSTTPSAPVAEKRDEPDRNGTTGSSTAPSTNGTLQLESLELADNDSEDTEEFVHAAQPKSNSRRKRKPKSFAE